MAETDGRITAVARGRRASAERLDALARHFRPALKRFFEKRVPDIGTEAEDLAQEVFVRLAQRDGSGDDASPAEIANIEGYIFQTAASVLGDRARRRAVRHAQAHVAFDPAVHGAEDFSLERVYSGRQEVAAVMAALAELPPQTREIFMLHRFEGETQPEIARRYGISLSWVEKNIMRAMAHLIARLRAAQGEP